MLRPRVCRDIAISRWYFEEIATFIEVTGSIAFWTVRHDPRMPPRLMEMWEHLRTYAMYFLFYRPGQHTVEQVREAQNHLYKYAVFAETQLGGRLCTVLLHRAVWHIPEQVLLAGPGGFMREDFGERSIRVTKHKITHAATRNAAQASARCCVLEMCMRRHKLKNPDIDLPLQRLAQAVVPARTDAGGEDGVQLHQLHEAYDGRDDDQVLARFHALSCYVLRRVQECYPVTELRRGVLSCVPQ